MKLRPIFCAALLTAAGCASHGSAPAGPPPTAESVLPSLAAGASADLDPVCHRMILGQGEPGGLLVFRSPRPEEEKAGPHDAWVRMELARALRQDPVLASGCDITSITPAEAAAVDTRADWKNSISVTGEVDPGALPKTYFPAKVWVGRVHFEQDRSGSGQEYRLEVTIWSPQKRTWEYSKTYQADYFPNGQGKWVRAPRQRP